MKVILVQLLQNSADFQHEPCISPETQGQSCIPKRKPNQKKTSNNASINSKLQHPPQATHRLLPIVHAQGVGKLNLALLGWRIWTGDVKFLIWNRSVLSLTIADFTFLKEMTIKSCTWMGHFNKVFLKFKFQWGCLEWESWSFKLIDTQGYV